MTDFIQVDFELPQFRSVDKFIYRLLEIRRIISIIVNTAYHKIICK